MDYKYDPVDDACYRENSSSFGRSKMQLGRYEIFETQDQEKGHFDCILEIHGKKIYCHKFVLAAASDIFNVMISDRWNNSKDGVIKIENPYHTYECFYEFLTFLYSGYCILTNENIFVLTDIAEFYGVELLKDRCETFLNKMDITVENVEKLLELAKKYELEISLDIFKHFINDRFYAIINAAQFLQHKKPFIEFIAAAIKSEKQPIFFEAVWEWGHHQATIMGTESKEEDFNVGEFIKAELTEILTKFDFTQMDFNFIKKSVLSKRILFSVSELYEIIAKCKRNNDQEEECFKILCQFAKTEAAKKKKKTTDDSIFDMNDAIKVELVNVLPYVRFTVMPIEFLMDFVVEKGFDFSLIEVYNYLKNVQGENSEEVAFKAVYELAEKQVKIKQQKSPECNFHLSNAIKINLKEIFPIVQYHQMRYTFLMTYVVEKGLFLSPSDLRVYYCKITPTLFDTIENAFQALYELAEKQVLMKQELSPDKNFNLPNAIKNELAYALPKIKFYEMDKNFINEFVVAKGIISKEVADHIFDVYLKIKNDGMSICGSFKDDYGIMEAISLNNDNHMPQAWNKQLLSNQKFKIPSIPSTVMKGADWYLCLEKEDGSLFVKHQTLIDKNDYLITEMKPKFNGEFMFNTEIISHVSTRYRNI